MRYVVPLSELSAADADRVGRKAATLGELMRAGFPVPDGFALTVDAGRDGSARRDQAGLREEVAAALAALGGGPVAVRSSGVAEDLADLSHAGQYESTLDVTGTDEVLDAARACWASGGSARLVAYRAGRVVGPGDDRALGVLVQAMVPAEAAGVAFGRNPVTGADETVVSAVRGLGDRLMAGARDGDGWRVRAGTATRTSGSGDALELSTVHGVASLTARVGAHLGAPQDVEWAVAGGTIWVLQARPIGAPPEVEPVPIGIEAPAGFASRHPRFPRPWVPLQRSIFLPVFSAACRHVFRYLTGAAPAAISVGGWVYLTVPPQDATTAARRVERAARLVAAGEPLSVVRRWREQWRPRYAARIAELREAPLAQLPDDALLEHLDAVLDVFAELHDRYFRLTGAAMALLGELGTACEELFGWSVAQTLRLRGGLTGDHMAAVTGLADLAALAARRPAVRAYLDAGGHATGLSCVDPEFAAAFDAHLCRFGHRTMDFELTEPTLAERPELVLHLVRTRLDRPSDLAAERAALAARTAAALAQARALLAGRPAVDRERFDAALLGSAESDPVRDEKVFYAVSVWALVRYAALEIGRRLVDRRVLDRPEDAFFLDVTQLRAALADRQPRQDRIRHARGQHAWAVANPGPPHYGSPPAPPADVTVSPAARRVLAVAQWTAGLLRGAPAGPGTDAGVAGGLRGVAASAGCYLGPVRVVRDAAEFGKVRRGDVLVCPETTAQWSVLFPSIGALVTDRGSMLSHPAILAREYGVPAVVATGTATADLRDGQLVTVDGGDGSVRPVAHPDGL